MAHGRDVYRRDSNANADTNTSAHSHAYAWPHTHADTGAKSESGIVQRYSGLVCERNIYGRSAGARERLHL
jgi:hypothetical protein